MSFLQKEPSEHISYIYDSANSSNINEISMSTKTIPQKLLIKPNSKVLLINEPEGYRAILGKLPGGVTIISEIVSPVDLIQVFVHSRKQLVDLLPKIKNLIMKNGILWVSYPKGKAEINRFNP